MCKQILALVAATATVFMSAQVWAANDDGVVLAASGQATAKGPDGATRKLDRRSPVNAGDTLVTGADGKVQFRMKDGTVLALGENSEFAIKQYSTKASGDKQDGAALKLVKGTLMQVSGNMEKSAYTLETPVSTLGIRGTVFSIRVNPDGTVTATVKAGAVSSASQQAVASAKQAVTTAQTTLDTAKAKVARLKAARASEEEIAAAQADADLAETALTEANQDLQEAVSANGGLLNEGVTIDTNPDGSTEPGEAIDITGSIEDVIKAIAGNDAADMAPFLEKLLPGLTPEEQQIYINIAKEAAPTETANIDRVAQEVAEQDGGGTNPPGSNDPTQETVVDQVNNTEQNNLTNTPDTETTNENTTSPP